MTYFVRDILCEAENGEYLSLKMMKLKHTSNILVSKAKKFNESIGMVIAFWLKRCSGNCHD